MPSDQPQISEQSAAVLTAARAEFHADLVSRGVLSVNTEGKPSIADGGNSASRALALGIFERLGPVFPDGSLSGQTAGLYFEFAVRDHLQKVISQLTALIPATYRVDCQRPISDFVQYAHLKVLEEMAAGDRRVRLALGGDYVVKPDVVVYRSALTDLEINSASRVVDGATASLASLRNSVAPILHASISCKLTIRSDRSQNSRLEALNLIRNRRGRAPHIAVVTAEPLPSRLASIAVGTGDFDCIYHVALPELFKTAKAAAETWEAGTPKSSSDRSFKAQFDKLELMIDSNRLKDISDLALDLAL